MVNKHFYNKDKKFGDFILKTRVNYYDEKIINDELSDIYKIPDNPKIVIDIGSHIGITSLMVAKKGAKIIYAFEPNNFNFEILQYNVKVNGFQDKIHCIKKGVGKPNKKVKLYIHPSMSGTHSTYLTQKGLTIDNYEEIEIISIKDVFKNYNIEHCSLLKMDCEGSEEDIIMDFDDELANKINQISLEFHNKKIIQYLVDKLSKWYTSKNTHRYEWVFRKKVIK